MFRYQTGSKAQPNEIDASLTRSSSSSSSRCIWADEKPDKRKRKLQTEEEEEEEAIQSEKDAFGKKEH